MLKRIDGVGDIQLFGVREYSMRIWLDPDRASSFGITPADITKAINAQSTQVAGGVVAEPPVTDQAFQSTLVFEGRLKKPAEFGNIIVKAAGGGRIVRLKDIARVELGALTYSTGGYLGDKPAVALAVLQRPARTLLRPRTRSPGPWPTSARISRRASRTKSATTRPASSPTASTNW